MDKASTELSDVAKITKNSSIYLALQVSGQTIGIVAALLLAKAFSIAEYGVYSFLFSLLSLSPLLMTTLGFAPSMAYHSSKYRAEGRSEYISYFLRFSLVLSLLLSVITVVIIFFSADFIAIKFLEPQYSYLIKIICIVIPLLFISSIISALLQGYEKIPYLGFLSFLSPLLKLVFILLLLYLLILNLTNLAYSIIAIYFLQLIVSLAFLRKIKLKKAEKTTLKPFLSYGVKASGSGLLYPITEQVPILMTAYFLTPELLGLFSIAYTTGRLVLFIPMAIRVSYFPNFTFRYSTNNEEANNLFHNILRLVMIISIPVLLCIVFFIDPFIIHFLPKYIPSIFTLKIISIGLFTASFTVILTATLAGIGKPLDFTMVDFMRFATLIPLSFILIPRFGIEGTGYSILFSFVTCFILAVILVRRGFNLSISKLKLKNILVPTIILATLFYVFSHLSNSVPAAIIIMALGLLAYMTLIILFKVIKVHEIRDGLSFIPVINNKIRK